MRHFDRIFQLFHNAEDTGGGGAPEWPDYEVPAGVGAGEDTASRDVTAGPTSAGTETAPGGEAQPQASHDGAGDQQPSGDAPANTPPPGNLPQGRLEQELARSNARYTALERRFNETSSLLTKLQQVFAPASDGQKTDPRTLAVRNRMMEVFPEFKALLDIAGRHGDLKSLLDRAPGLTSQEERYWDAVATRTMASVHAQIAPFMLGEGGTAEKLNDAQKYYLREQFKKWCESDEKRIDRYERGDEKIVEEFRDWYVALNYAPARRQAVVAAASRAAAGAALPRAGRADATATSVPKADPTDDDAIHNSGWSHVQNAFAARR